MKAIGKFALVILLAIVFPMAIIVSASKPVQLSQSEYSAYMKEKYDFYSGKAGYKSELKTSNFVINGEHIHRIYSASVPWKYQHDDIICKIKEVNCLDESCIEKFTFSEDHKLKTTYKIKPSNYCLSLRYTYCTEKYCGLGYYDLEHSPVYENGKCKYCGVPEE